MQKKLFLYLVLFVLMLSGCAVGNVYNFTDTRADIKYSLASGKNAAVATHDQRADVVKEICDPSYVGMQRAGFGNPWRVHTASGLPFADDVTKAVAESLSAKGYRTIPVFVMAADERSRVMDLMRAKKADRNLLFIVKKWESDTYTNIGLTYEIELKVFDEKLNKLGEISAAESKTIPGSVWDPPSAARREIPLAFKQILENLLNDQKIRMALQ